MGISASRLLSVLLLATVFFTSLAQGRKSAGRRPKVGLVLSGGGAKGAAHAGVIKKLEDMGIPIDYIGGTSLGAVVGGLYAIGYEPDQIAEVMKSMDFKKYSLNLPGRQKLGKLDKQYYDKYVFSLPVKKLWGFQISRKGLSNGHNLLRHLYRLTKSSIKERDFSKFKIPFLCVSTDLVTGEEVVIKEGNLAKVLRASSSFPTVFEPFDLDGRLMVDGGITNNFPASHVKDMGADILIGVDVQTELSSRDGLSSVYQIIDQMSSFRMAERNRNEREICDLIIRPDISGVGVMDLGEASVMVDRGFLAAQHSEELDEIAYRLSRFDKEEPKQDKNFLADSILIDSFEVVGKTTFPKEYFESGFSMDEYQKFSHDQIGDVLEKLHATGYFSHLSYDFYQIRNKTKLSLVVEDKEENTHFKFGINYNSIQETRILINFTRKNLLFENDLFSLDWALSKHFNVNMDYRFISSVLFPGFYVKFENYSFLLDRTPSIMQKYSNLRNNFMSYGKIQTEVYLKSEIPTINTFLSLSGGLEFVSLGPTAYSKDDANPYRLIYDTNVGIKFSIERDTYDSRYFPKHGSYAYLSTELFYSAFKNKQQEAMLSSAGIAIRARYEQVFGFFFKDLYFKYDILIADYLDVGNIKEFLSGKDSDIRFPMSKVLNVGGGLSIGDSESFMGVPYMYNFYRIFGKLNTELRYEVFEGHYISSIVDIGYAPYNEESLSDKLLYGLGISYGYDSVLGPVNLVWGVGKKNVYFSLNVGLNF